MRILIATGLYPLESGGPALFAKLLEHELPRRGVDVSVVPFRIVRRYPYLIRNMVYFWKLLVAGRRADLILALDPVSVGLPAAVSAFLLRRRFMVRVAGDYAWEQGRQRFGVTDPLETFAATKTGYDFFVWLFKVIQLSVSCYAERVIVPSEYMKRIVASWGVPDERIMVLYSVVEPIGHCGNKQTLRAILKFNGKLLISVGRLVPWKGFDTLIEILPRLRKKIPTLKLLIVGDGPDRERLTRLIEDRGLEDVVIMTGVLERPVLFRYIKLSDVFVLNTSYEGFSHQILEVMAIGIPVITTRVGGNLELVEDGKNGILVSSNHKDELEAAIVKLFTDKDEAMRLSRIARERVRRFSVERMIGSFIHDVL